MSSSTFHSIDYNDTIPFVPDVQTAQVIKVYDGDTFTIGFFQPYSAKPFRMLVRLLGIDTPEMKGKFKTKAKAAQEFLSSQIMGRVVELSNVSMEKYGRLLADVHCNGVHINKLMLDDGHAITYNGGTKST